VLRTADCSKIGLFTPLADEPGSKISPDAGLLEGATVRLFRSSGAARPVGDNVGNNSEIALIALVGGTLIYGARKPAVRPLALTIAGASKAIFIALVLSHGGRFLGYQAGIAVFVDAVWVMVFASYLLAVRRAPAGDATVVSTIKTV
jgi:hypothetical protein